MEEKVAESLAVMMLSEEEDGPATIGVRSPSPPHRSTSFGGARAPPSSDPRTSSSSLSVSNLLSLFDEEEKTPPQQQQQQLERVGDAGVVLGRVETLVKFAHSGNSGVELREFAAAFAVANREEERQKSAAARKALLIARETDRLSAFHFGEASAFNDDTVGGLEQDDLLERWREMAVATKGSDECVPFLIREKNKDEEDGSEPRACHWPVGALKAAAGLVAFASACFGLGYLGAKPSTDPDRTTTSGTATTSATDGTDGTYPSGDAGFGTKPHIVVLLADNLGWANVGFHRPPEADPREFQTPTLDALAATGIELDRHYTYKMCSPSRSSFLTGRLPVHVNIYNDDPARIGQGVPENMTMIAAKLRGAGYHAHMIGKWHVGMARRSRHVPEARGFETSLAYFHSANNYFNLQRSEGCDALPAMDLWDTGAPFAGELQYEETLFGNRALGLLAEHDPDEPLFLYYAFHSSCVGWDAGGEAGGEHMVLQPDPSYYERFRFIDDPDRRANHAMVALMDDIIGDIVDELKRKDMWETTLLLWSSDNGGAVHLGGGANTWPLRGGYYNNWEGGIRVAALLNGGAIPEAVRGSKLEGFIHEADWYATFCHLAGVDPRDAWAEASSLPPVDSLNVWPLITGANTTSPRYEWPITPLGEESGCGTILCASRALNGGDAAYMAEGRFKLLVGNVSQSGWPGQVHPNLTQPWDSIASVERCTMPEIGKVGCLFDILDDPSERHDLALEMPEKAAEIFAKMVEAEKDFFNPDRGEPDPRACQIAKDTGFWQPFLD